MSKLWKWLDCKDVSKMTKIRIFILLNSLLYSVLGFVVWLFIKSFALNTWDWAVCFVCYPGFYIGYIGGFLFLCRQ